ncbi:hypothetical protein HAX54_047891 [Datura stramonium]|uniref:PGG domain-containing protein n=1 Tax=Datura stramonium TaxID=4076 RepID=A0ABS8WIQ1_DATST|nr:hypothetical protein [Datura stramonium]
MEASMPRKTMKKQLTGKREDSVLHSLARAGNLVETRKILDNTREEELVELLVKQNSAGETPLYVAAEYGYCELVKEMIKYCDLVAAGIKARNGFDALHIAAKQGDLDVVKVLMLVHPELSMTVDVANTTALHSAANQGHIQVVNYLLEAESSLATIAKKQMLSWINIAGHEGNTALHIAARKGRAQIVKFLLEQNETDTKAVNRSNETAVDTAEKMGQANIAVILQEAGVQSARAIKPQTTNPARELKQTVSDIKHEVHYQMEHTRQTRKRIHGIAKRTQMHAEGLNNAINSTTVVAVLIATVAFAAIFSVPGQYIEYPEDVPPGHSRRSKYSSESLISDILRLRLCCPFYLSGSCDCSDINRSDRKQSKEADDGYHKQAHVVSMCANFSGFLSTVLCCGWQK